MLVVLAMALAPSQSFASAPVSIVGGDSTYQASSPLAPAVQNMQPAPGTVIRAFFPRFSAFIDTHDRAPLRRTSIHFYVDGKDVTEQASILDGNVAYLPREHLGAGWHDVFLQGADLANRTFSQAWVFRSQSPDIDVPLSGDGGFAFAPVGAGGPFMHFFFVSPFDGFSTLQLCNFSVPLTHAGGSPVFFVTVPATLGTLLLGCNSGFVFTPFGIAQAAPIFFPIGIAGPGFFENGGHNRRIPLPAEPTTVQDNRVRMPVYPQQTMPVYRSGATPGNPARTMPVYRVPVMGLPRVPSIPRPYIPGRPASARPRANTNSQTGYAVVLNADS